MCIAWAITMMVTQLRFAKDMDVLGGRPLKCTAQVSSEAQVLSLCKVTLGYFRPVVKLCFGRQGKRFPSPSRWHKEYDFLMTLTGFAEFLNSKSTGILFEIFLLGTINNATPPLTQATTPSFRFPPSLISLMSTEFLLNATKIRCRPE